MPFTIQITSPTPTLPVHGNQDVAVLVTASGSAETVTLDAAVTGDVEFVEPLSQVVVVQPGTPRTVFFAIGNVWAPGTLTISGNASGQPPQQEQVTLEACSIEILSITGTMKSNSDLTVSVRSNKRFRGAVDFSATGGPITFPGPSLSLTENQTRSIDCRTGNIEPGGTHSIDIKAHAKPTLTHSFPLALAAAGIKITPSVIQVVGSGEFTAKVTSIDRFRGKVTITKSSTPGTTVTFLPASGELWVPVVGDSADLVVTVGTIASNATLTLTAQYLATTISDTVDINLVTLPPGPPPAPSASSSRSGKKVATKGSAANSVRGKSKAGRKEPKKAPKRPAKPKLPKPSKKPKKKPRKKSRQM